MRLVLIIAVLASVTGCAGYHSRQHDPGSAYDLPPPGAGGEAWRDGFYDGGIYDLDLTSRSVWLPE
ncbi:MAG TPA: hypothetical protein VL974_09290 [Magnetospirillum sp.]|jgi:hypothetical protein|nr:hypothetical protein [Magnetospirillum sp.]